VTEASRQPTADSVGLHERASATPVGSAAPAGHTTAARSDAQRPSLSGHAPSFANHELTLRTQQEWFAAIVSTPESEAPPVDELSAARLITPSRTLSSLARIEIYRRGYHARLIECLADDYPVLQHALGEEAFEALCRAYIARYPSTGPSLNYFGRHMAELCRATPESAPGFAADLATLEWAIVLGIHAPTAPALGLSDLSAVPPASFPSARFKVNPSLSILRLAHPVNAYLQGFRNGEAPAPPEPGKSTVAVYRTGKSVWRLELDDAMVTLVEALAVGATLEASLERLQVVLSDRSDQEAAALVSACFRHSVSSGLFSALLL
jgi:hypothetical protein